MKFVRPLSGTLSFLVVAFAPGLAPYQAAAQALKGGTPAVSGLSGVAGSAPRIELSAPALTPLSPNLGLVPALGGALAPTIPAPSIGAPAFTGGAPVLPASALAATPLVPAFQTAGPAADVKGQLAIAGGNLAAAASKDNDRSGILDSFFTGAKKIASMLADEPAAGVPSALAPAVGAVSNGHRVAFLANGKSSKRALVVFLGAPEAREIRGLARSRRKELAREGKFVAAILGDADRPGEAVRPWAPSGEELGFYKKYEAAVKLDKAVDEKLMRLFGVEAPALTPYVEAYWADQARPTEDLMIAASARSSDASESRTMALQVLAERADPASLPLLLQVLSAEERAPSALSADFLARLANAVRAALDKIPEDAPPALKAPALELARSAGPQFGAFEAAARLAAPAKALDGSLLPSDELKATMRRLEDVYRQGENVAAFKELKARLETRRAALKAAAGTAATPSAVKLEFLAAQTGKDVSRLSDLVSYKAVAKLTSSRDELLRLLGRTPAVAGDEMLQGLDGAKDGLLEAKGHLDAAGKNLDFASNTALLDVFVPTGLLSRGLDVLQYVKRSSASGESSAAERALRRAKAHIENVRRLSKSAGVDVQDITPIGDGALVSLINFAFDSVLTELFSWGSIAGDQDRNTSALEHVERELDAIDRARAQRVEVLLVKAGLLGSEVRSLRPVVAASPAAAN